MSKSSTITIACALCVGSAPEPYLAATLASIRDAVDVLVVNDNSSAAVSPHDAILRASAFAALGALRVERHAFVDFADMRNRAFDSLAAVEPRPDWVMWLDADEVHGARVRRLAREILPSLDGSVGSVDGYTYHFSGTFDWVTDVARRFTFYRYDPGLRWTNPIHEKIVGLRGRSLVLPYVYHHYGNVAAPRVLADKYERYHRLGNVVPPREDPSSLAIYLEKIAAVRPYRGSHPPAAAATLAALRREWGPTFERVDAAYRAGRTPFMRARASVRSLNENLRIGLRVVEHPLLARSLGPS
jgi:hypothetical protein